MSWVVLGSVVPWILVFAGLLLIYQLIGQNGRILMRLDEIERRLPPPMTAPTRPAPQGLPIGMPAPQFELPDLQGNAHRLSDYRGRELLLLFFNPGCGYCTRMAADLAAIPVDGASGRPIPIVVTTGDVDANRKLVDQHGFKCLVLLQTQTEIAAQFRAQGTPMGYRIDAAGRIASELTVGADQLLQLAAGRPGDDRMSGSSDSRAGQPGKHPDPSLARSRLNRNGLKAGTPAPDFRLPAIDGTEFALDQCRGRRVLLVFSDPDCGPCDELAPMLQELHEERTDLNVVVVSRRDPEATRAKAEKLGLTYPIVMQKQWELSLKYGMFATPIGYLIDEQGVLQSDVAVGVDPIRQLTAKHNGREEGGAAELRVNGELLTTH